jgi:predicted Fe-Mo cluster-binding NifX family protein
MKVAVPVFGTRVSPRFDDETALLIVEIDDGAVGLSVSIAGCAENPLQRVARLRELGVEAVICGAVTGFLLRHMMANSIQVFPRVSGEASEALQALARGELAPARLPEMKQGRGCGRRRRGRAGPCWSQ